MQSRSRLNGISAGQKEKFGGAEIVACYPTFAAGVLSVKRFSNFSMKGSRQVSRAAAHRDNCGSRRRQQGRYPSLDAIVLSGVGSTLWTRITRIFLGSVSIVADLVPAVTPP
jgi:hypothetical protein